MAGLETVYAIHSFEPDNVDEVGFNVGDPIIVLEKDEGYNDGWWQGRNVQGEIGLFPMNYTSYQPLGQTTVTTPSSSLDQKIDSLEDAISKIQLTTSKSNLTQLPTPSTSTSTKKSRDNNNNHHSHSRSQSQQHLPRANSLSSLNSSAQSHSTTHTPARSLTTASKNVQKALTTALMIPILKNTSPEDWDVDQVAAWLGAMGFESVAGNFKTQEITGDILLELTIDSLKELDVNTFGKRFKIHSAINALRDGITRRHTPKPSITGSEDLNDDYGSQYSSSRPMSPNGVNDFDSVTTTSEDISRTGRLYSMDTISSVRSRQEPTTATTPGRMSIGRKNVPQAASVLMQQQQQLQQQNIHHSESGMKRKTFAVPEHGISRQYSTAEPRYDHHARNSFSPTSKPQTVLPVASRASMDSLAHRAALPDVTPDMEGWLNKQGDKYKTWNKRWFVLKGPNLFYFKSPKDVRMKGIINLRGYRIISDETIYAGKYCFKAQHERERTFYFYTDSENIMKAWMKTLMKATIARDYGAPVLSSSTIPTVSLDMARRMKPRPPSMILYKKENRPQSPSLESIDSRPFSLTYCPQDAQPISRISFDDHFSERPSMSSSSRMESSHHGGLSSIGIGSRSTSHDDLGPQNRESGITDFDDTTTTPSLSLTESKQELQDSGFDSTHGPMSSALSSPPSIVRYAPTPDDHEEEEDLIDPQHMDVMASNRPGGLKRLTEESHISSSEQSSLLLSSSVRWSTSDYVDWVQRNVERKVANLNDFRSGELLIELLENLSGKDVRRPPPTNNASANMQILDNIVAAFKFMGREGVEVDGRYTIKDVFGGNEPKIKEMLDAIKTWSNTFHNEKKASGGTFGEREQLKMLD
ncbi:hypothetical protein BDA99DRAFT_523017 [Phascolomyces articulosus]|uniref:Polar growth protein n=1 Tax=Phascolomyces articulosus TaxID=60185 RepID=A0AAD5P9H6_9FUNG|nr:hypothetical protein BDA99DRAFT_523017 [Phascolomyces articulosus]